MKYDSAYTVPFVSDMSLFPVRKSNSIEKEQIDEHTGHPELVMTFKA